MKLLILTSKMQQEK